MKPNRTNAPAAGKKKHIRRCQIDQLSAIDHAVTLMDAVCAVAGSERLIGGGHDGLNQKLRSAIASHDTALLFAKLVEGFSFQGISDHAAITYMKQHGRVTWHDIERALVAPTSCKKLQSYWAFYDCQYEKSNQTCTEPLYFGACPLPTHDLRNGRLNQTAYSLFLFIRDVAGGDLVSWIDNQLRKADRGTGHGRLSRMREAVIGPMRHVYGVSDKVLCMALSDLLMAAPRTKRHWIETGACMIAIDTLVHNFLHRTGILRRFNAQHVYGLDCYRTGGCMEIIEHAATKIDARQFNTRYPKVFPRFVQHAIWRFCAQQELDVCNGNRLNDQRRCANKGCPLFHLCDRVALQKLKAASR
jgi:hypothetical protein